MTDPIESRGGRLDCGRHHSVILACECKLLPRIHVVDVLCSRNLRQDERCSVASPSSGRRGKVNGEAHPSTHYEDLRVLR